MLFETIGCSFTNIQTFYSKHCNIFRFFPPSGNVFDLRIFITIVLILKKGNWFLIFIVKLWKPLRNKKIINGHSKYLVWMEKLVQLSRYKIQNLRGQRDIGREEVLKKGGTAKEITTETGKTGNIRRKTGDGEELGRGKTGKVNK